VVSGQDLVNTNGTFIQSGGTNTIEGEDVLLIVEGAYDLSGGTLSSPETVNLGTINVTGGSANLGALLATGSLNVGNPSGMVTLASLQQDSVSISSGGLVDLTGGGGSNAVSSLLVTGSGVLNIQTTDLIINYGSSSDPVSAIYGYIKSGYNNGNWNGPGIISSNALTPTNGFKYGVGWADGADGVVAGLSSGQIEIKYTLLGDANLDGTVNGSDFSILAANFGTGDTNWDQGNFLYGSSVNGADFAALAANFGQGDNGTDIAVSQADIAALDSFAEANGLPLPAIGAVPEPACAALFAMAGLGALARRRRRT
jgi:hypothetical protein